MLLGCSLKVFAFAGIIGILVLLPINCWGDQLEDIDVADFANNSLDVFTISNVNSGSRWWILPQHFVVVLTEPCLENLLQSLGNFLFIAGSFWDQNLYEIVIHYDFHFRLWVHFSAVYAITGFTCLLLFYVSTYALLAYINTLSNCFSNTHILCLLHYSRLNYGVLRWICKI